MKLSIAQALGTVLNIQVSDQPGGKQWFVIRTPGQAIDKFLGVVGESTLEQAVWKAVELANFGEECHFAIFPMGSGREDYYMSIERELLRQEASKEFDGKKMWELLGNDPRQAIMNIMEQLRTMIPTIMQPMLFQTAMIQTGCLVIATLQWSSDWISKLKVRQAALATRDKPQEPRIVVPAKFDGVDQGPPPRELPPLFGNPSLSVYESPAGGTTREEEIAHGKRLISEEKGSPEQQGEDAQEENK